MAVTPDITRLINEIRVDRTHGAGELARQALSVLSVAAEGSQAATSELFLEEIGEIGKELISARPPMASVRNIVNRLLG